MNKDSTSNGNPRWIDPAQAFVLISYRRADTGVESQRLYDRLAEVYGADRVFMDVRDVLIGVDHVEKLRAQIERCSAVLVVIGPAWLAATDERGQRRLDLPDDPVRAEVALALKQKHIQVIPVLVRNASLSADGLPANIRLLARRNWIVLRPEHWEDDVERLMLGLQTSLPPA